MSIPRKNNQSSDSLSSGNPIIPAESGNVNPTAPQGPTPGTAAPAAPKSNKTLIICCCTMAVAIIAGVLIYFLVVKKDKSKDAEPIENALYEEDFGPDFEDDMYVTPNYDDDWQEWEEAEIAEPEEIYPAEEYEMEGPDIPYDHSYDVTQRRLGADDLRGLSKDELRLLRNTIFAVHGRRFKSEDLREYFSMFEWYHPYRDEVPESEFSEIEMYNLNQIKKYER